MPEHHAYFLANLFDDITTSRVITEMNLDKDMSSKRRTSLDGTSPNSSSRPLKKIRFDSASPRSSMLTMPASRHNLAELSFPPLPLQQQPRKSFSGTASCSGIEVPLPAVALTKRRLAMGRGWEIGMVDNSGFSDFIVPDKSNLNEEVASSCLKSSPLRASSNQQEQGSLTEESPEFGWFVDTL
jgi:hypothetical protein